ncbi:MAG: arginyl-tRNA synthetase [Luteibaculaceae bacterium]|jgi:arginyl-tRNA synthetase
MLEQHLSQYIKDLAKAEKGAELSDAQIQIQKTRKEFAGDITLVVFPLARIFGGAPEAVANLIGAKITAELPNFVGFNVVKGFLNLEIDTTYFIQNYQEQTNQADFGSQKPNSTGRTVMVEYASPNTNKPLHLGHLRNIFLGYSVAEILKANGHVVKKTQIINDRGIHICKSMVAWVKFGNGETPDSTGLKGDKLVGKYYVAFDKHYKIEMAELMAQGMEEDLAKKEAPIFKEAQAYLLKWEAKDTEVYALWEKMNSWVYAGFEVTYNRMGVDFDSLYYESETYLLGKEMAEAGLDKGVFFKKDDGSVWCDLSEEGLDHKLVLRADGTAVYMTQDIGTAILRYRDEPNLNQIIYTVGNEQDYHFQVLFKILQKLGYEWAQNCYHLSYGMVDLPTGKMKSREGTVVDADDIMQEMADSAKGISEELGKLEGKSEEEKEALFETIGQGALKYFLLKVDPKKRMLFNPEESIDFNGHTGPFIQYTHARICSLLEKNGGGNWGLDSVTIGEEERDLLKKILEFTTAIQEAGADYSPAALANYLFDLVKVFNRFYQNVNILKEEKEEAKNFRLDLTKKTGLVVKKGMHLLGIAVPDRM